MITPVYVQKKYFFPIPIFFVQLLSEQNLPILLCSIFSSPAMRRQSEGGQKIGWYTCVPQTQPCPGWYNRDNPPNLPERRSPVSSSSSTPVVLISKWHLSKSSSVKRSSQSSNTKVPLTIYNSHKHPSPISLKFPYSMRPALTFKIKSNKAKNWFQVMR